MGAPMQSPLLFAVGSNDHESVRDLLMYRADVNYTPVGREPPVCVAFRHRMLMIAGTLLEHRADPLSRDYAGPRPGGATEEAEGVTLPELADGNQVLCQLLLRHAPADATVYASDSVPRYQT